MAIRLSYVSRETTTRHQKNGDSTVIFPHEMKSQSVLESPHSKMIASSHDFLVDIHTGLRAAGSSATLFLL